MTGAAPVVVLGCQYSGVAWVQELLAADPSLACTGGTGLLPACELAATAWRQADGRPDGPLSSLGAASVRAMAVPLISSVLVRAGRQRWCEAAAPGSAAGTFLKLFPGTRFVCLYRSCLDVIRATFAAGPWGLTGRTYMPYVMAHPVSSAAALTAYWVEQAEQLLEFERDQPGACLRVRYEDLLTDGTARQDLWKFLGLDPGELPAPGFPAAPRQPGTDAQLPAPQLPPGVLARVNELHAALGYPLVASFAPDPSARAGAPR